MSPEQSITDITYTDGTLACQVWGTLPRYDISSII